MGVVMVMFVDINKVFKIEWEVLELMDYQWVLDDVEEEFMVKDFYFEGMFKKELQIFIF